MLDKFVSKVATAVKNGVDTVKEDKALYEQIKKKNEENQKRMAESVEDYSKTELILKEEARRLDEIAVKIVADYQKIGEIIQQDMAETKIATQEIQKVSALDFSNAMFGAVAGGTAAAGGAVALITAFCTAGTGTAISGLTGIFYAKATLAALGGGTLASGGLGMAGGVAVGAALFAIPAAIVGGFIAHNTVIKREKEVNEAEKKVDEAVEINATLAERNRIATENIRKIYDLGVTIDFFLHNLRYRLENAPTEIKEDMKKVAAVARSRLVETFIKIEPLTADKQRVSENLKNELRRIEDECRTLSNLSNSHGKIYTAKNITPVFQQIYRDAEEYIYMSYPWFNDFAVKSDLYLINQALRRGVKFRICYGFGNDERYRDTVAAINWLKNNISVSDAVTFVRVNSHRKIILCEKYILYGSQNMMTYRYNEDRSDKRDEVTVKVEDKNAVEEFKNLILKQKVF